MILHVTTLLYSSSSKSKYILPMMLLSSPPTICATTAIDLCQCLFDNQCCSSILYCIRSSTAALPLAFQAQGFFLSPPPPMSYYDGSPPFSPPTLFPPLLYPPYFAPQFPGSAGLSYAPPPQVNSHQQLPPMVPYNVAN